MWPKLSCTRDDLAYTSALMLRVAMALHWSLSRFSRWERAPVLDPHFLLTQHGAWCACVYICEHGYLLACADLNMGLMYMCTHEHRFLQVCAFENMCLNVCRHAW